MDERGTPEEIISENLKEFKLLVQGKHPTIPNKLYFKDGFERHAEMIYNQIKNQKLCTRSQLEYLILYNSMLDNERPYRLSKDITYELKIFGDDNDTDSEEALTTDLSDESENEG